MKDFWLDVFSFSVIISSLLFSYERSGQETI